MAEPETPPLSKWVKNQNVTLDMKGGVLTITSQQSRSTPGVRINGIQVQVGQRYLLGVNGTCSAGNAFLNVKQSKAIWKPHTVKLGSDSCLSFAADSNSVDIGVLFGAVVSSGDVFTIQSWTLIREPTGFQAAQAAVIALKAKWDQRHLVVSDLSTREKNMRQRVSNADETLAEARVQLGDAKAEVVAAETALTRSLVNAGLASMANAAIEKVKRMPYLF